MFQIPGENRNKRIGKSETYPLAGTKNSTGELLSANARRSCTEKLRSLRSCRSISTTGLAGHFAEPRCSRGLERVHCSLRARQFACWKLRSFVCFVSLFENFISVEIHASIDGPMMLSGIC